MANIERVTLVDDGLLVGLVLRAVQLPQSNSCVLETINHNQSG